MFSMCHFYMCVHIFSSHMWLTYGSHFSNIYCIWLKYIYLKSDCKPVAIMKKFKKKSMVHKYYNLPGKMVS